MDNYAIILLVLVLMIGASGIAEKLNIPIPLILLVLGLAIGFAPFIPDLVLSQDIIMLLFLPPLLYDAAFNISFRDFKANIQTIGTLSIGLVFITTAGIAVIMHYLIPHLGWPHSFLIGAILSATDAVAAIGLTKGIGISNKTTTILEGESLINDASALIAYRFSLAAVTGIEFSKWKAPLQFLFVLGGGLLIGLVISYILSYMIQFFRKSDLVAISLMMLMPFVTYLVAEHFHVSGVIAVVVLGLGMSKLSRAKCSSLIKDQSRHFWSILTFLLNGLIFLVIGMAFPVILKRMSPEQVFTYLGYAIIIVLAALMIRMIWIYTHRYRLQKSFQLKRRGSAEAFFDSKTGVVISWSGMRGIVSLAMAIGLPETLENGSLFPMRNEIVFLSITVVLVSLVGQGITLPWIVKRFKPEDSVVKLE